MKQLRHIFSLGILIALVSSASAQAWLTNGLVAYYPFNGNANDESGNGNDGVSYSVPFSPIYLESSNSVAVMTGGQDQWVEVPHSASLNVDALTISLWCYNNRSDNSDVRFLCGKREEQFEIHIGGQPYNPLSGIRFIPGNGSLIDTLAGSPTRQWTHIVCSAGAQSGGGAIYIDGHRVTIVVTAGNAAAPIAFSSDRFAIGMRGGNSGWGHFDGRIMNFRIYNRALNSNEVSQLYGLESLVLPMSASIASQPQSVTADAGSSTNLSVTATGSQLLTYQWLKDGVALPGATNATLVFSNLQPVHVGDYLAVVSNGGGSVTSSVASVSIPGVNSGLWQGLVAYYPFNGNANDESGFERNGQALVNGPILSTNRYGITDAAYYFSGTNGGILVTNSMHPRGFNPNLSTCFWMKTTFTDVLRVACGVSSYTTGSGSLSAIGANEALVYSVHNGEKYFTNRNDLDNVWRQVVFTKTGQNLSLFIDGVLSQTAVADSTTITSSNFFVGWNGNFGLGLGQQWIGSLDDVRIYNRALSSNEVAQLYALEFPDADKDGLSDYEEINVLGTNPNKSDTDGDGLTDFQEVRVRLTNPIVADTDGDGFNDYAEIYTAHNPLLNTDYPAANLSAFTAIELEFVTKVGTTYQLQTSPDLVTWTNFDNAIIGDGNIWKKTYSTRAQPRLYHRVESVP